MNERTSVAARLRAFFDEFSNSNWSDIAAIHILKQRVAEAEAKLIILKQSKVSTSVKERVAQTFELLII